jgi:hypothetical protein
MSDNVRLYQNQIYKNNSTNWNFGLKLKLIFGIVIAVHLREG